MEYHFSNYHFNGEAIIGTILIVWGISIFIKLIWGIDIPIFKPLLAGFLIYLGLSMLLGWKNNLIDLHYTHTHKSEPENDEESETRNR